MTENQTQLKAGAIGTAEVTIMAICAAGPAFCLAGSMGLMAAQTGRGVGLAAIIATLAVVLIGLSYGKLSEKYNRCGGTWSYIQQAIGQKAGLWTAFVYFGVLMTTSACPASIFSINLNYLIPGLPMWVIWFMFVAAVCFITWFGVELSTKVLVVVWVVQMVLLAWPAIKIIAMAPEGFNFATSMTNTFTPDFGIVGLGLAAVTWVWAYVGFEAPAYMGEELKGGSKAVKFAIPVSGLAVGVIYVISAWLWTGTMSQDEMAAIAGSGTFLSDYAALVGYVGGDTLVAIAALVSSFACGLAFFSFMPRFLYDLGREGILPKGLTKLNKHQIPHRSMFTYGIVSFFMSMYALYGYSANGLFNGINDWFVIMGMNACIAYAFICIANIKDGWKETSFWNGIILRKIVPIITTALLLYMVASSFGSPLYIIVFFIFVIGGVIFAFARANAKKDY